MADHPRSRGVYRVSQRTHYRPLGSSPLARGLLNVFCIVAIVVGIIPARAGSTDECRRHFEFLWDHPRSRGVYQMRYLMCLLSQWIIPARAGST